MKKILSAILFVCYFLPSALCAESDRLWLTYCKQSPEYSRVINDYCKKITLPGSSFDQIIKKEFNTYCTAATGHKPAYGKEGQIVMTYGGGPEIGSEGYVIRCTDHKIRITASADAGFLYATYHLIRLFRTEQLKNDTIIVETPAFDIRMLNHWDDLDGNIERGYAGRSLWKWQELPSTISERYEEYARINASIGINAVVLNNVNADPRILRTDYIRKVAVIAAIFRKYNIKTYLSANFAAPMKPSDTPDKMKCWGGIGTLSTADPLNPEVIDWWNRKTDEIYRYIPDFGGFLVKANSEGMPGPQDYGHSHATGANMLAKALKPHGGIVIWRAFVYQSKKSDPDRMKRAYQEFMPLDGQFDDNVILQIKNGPLDFQPSEPPSTLFGALQHTPVMAELQITQEYMGHSTYLVYLLPMWKKFLDFDTFCKGKPRYTISRILKGEVYPQKITAIAGVANSGDDPNWTGHYFAQANWYAYGRLAWNPEDDTRAITTDWIRMTWHSDHHTTEKIRSMMMPSWESFMKSSSPYGLGITTNMIIHYDADFAFRNGKEWTANKEGIGTDRTSRGSNYVSQYFEPNRSIFDSLDYCPEELLLAFHFVKWNRIMKNNETFHDYFMRSLKSKIITTEENIRIWNSLKNEIDPERHQAVSRKLDKELDDAKTFYNTAYSFFKDILH